MVLRGLLAQRDKKEFFKSMEKHLSLDEPLEEFLSSEDKMNEYLEGSQGYIDYDENECMFIKYSGTNDGVQCASISEMEDRLYSELMDILFYDGFLEEKVKSYLDKNEIIAKDNKELIESISIKLLDYINSL